MNLLIFSLQTIGRAEYGCRLGCERPGGRNPDPATLALNQFLRRLVLWFGRRSKGPLNLTNCINEVSDSAEIRPQPPVQKGKQQSNQRNYEKILQDNSGCSIT